MRKIRNQQQEIVSKIAAVGATIAHEISVGSSPAVNAKTISHARPTVAASHRIRSAAGRRVNLTPAKIIAQKGALKGPNEAPEAKAAISKTSVIHVSDGTTAKVTVVVKSVRAETITKPEAIEMAAITKQRKAMHGRTTTKAVRARVVSDVPENADRATTPSADVARVRKMILSKSLMTPMGT
jgi:hypothetical protein